MDKRIKHRLGETNSQRAVNGDAFDKIGIEQSNKPLPVGELNRILDVGERFNDERQNSTCYRLNGTISTIFSNVLYNSTGNGSRGEILTNTLFRDESFPPNGANANEEEDLTYQEALKEHIQEKDGWYGYIDPDKSKEAVCLFYDMEPSRQLFGLSPKNKVKNWELTVTYPSFSASTNMTNGGLLVVEITPVLIGNRPMIALATPCRHGLSQGDTVRVSGLSLPLDGDFTVVRVGLDNGDLKEHYFVIDIDPTTGVAITNNTRMTRMVVDQETVYYYRVFEKIGTINSPELEDDDYEVYQLAFSRGIFNDANYQFVINEDIDIEGLSDNLGRPLSEMYITLMKTSAGSGGRSSFTPIQSGIEIPFIGGVSSFETSVPDIRRIHNGVTPTPHTPLESDVLIGNNQFFGDIVSYNKLEVKETVLAEVRHRFNTYNREVGGIVVDPEGIESPVDMGSRQEGYFYKPHWQIRLREYSNYIEQGDNSTGGIPSYAEDLGDGRYLWRDLLDIGFSDVSTTPVDYPFLNGCHYIHQNYCFWLKRQDPFAQYGLYYGDFPMDPFGDRMTDNFVVNKSEDAC